MYQLVDIFDLILGDYDHCPTWKELNISTRPVPDVGHSYKDKPILVYCKGDRAVDFQILEPDDDNLYIYLQEPFSAAVRSELQQVLRLSTLAEENVVYAVAKPENVAVDIRADKVCLNVPQAQVQEMENHPACKPYLDTAAANGYDVTIHVPYTEEYMHEFLPRGFVILDYLYVLQ